MTVQTQAERPFSEGAVTLIELLVAVLKACIENSKTFHSASSQGSGIPGALSNVPRHEGRVVLYFLKNACVHARLIFSSARVSYNQEVVRASLHATMSYSNCFQCEL